MLRNKNTSDTSCGVLRHCRHRLDGLILYSQSQSHVVTIPYDYFLHSYTLHCWLFSPWGLSSSGSNIYNSPTFNFQPWSPILELSGLR
jgi:hypothetical protein